MKLTHLSNLSCFLQLPEHTVLERLRKEEKIWVLLWKNPHRTSENLGTIPDVAQISLDMVLAWMKRWLGQNSLWHDSNIVGEGCAQDKTTTDKLEQEVENINFLQWYPWKGDPCILLVIWPLFKWENNTCEEYWCVCLIVLPPPLTKNNIYFPFCTLI